MRNVYFIAAFVGALVMTACTDVTPDRPAGSVIPNISVPEAVDLGLSVKWASCNVGASFPEEYGDYYAWGEVSPKLDYNANNYRWAISGYLSKYCVEDKYGYIGTLWVDAKTVLEYRDDVAAVSYGGRWRMPTLTEYLELVRHCDREWISIEGVKGVKFTSNKEGFTEKWIFFPAGGCLIGSEVESPANCYYWTSSLYIKDSRAAFNMHIIDDYDWVINGYLRYYGFFVRAVCD